MAQSCREGCAACCIAPSISALNKAAGVPCVHLDDALRCSIFGTPKRPAVCGLFQPAPDVCGDNREQALDILRILEESTAPDA